MARSIGPSSVLPPHDTVAEQGRLMGDQAANQLRAASRQAERDRGAVGAPGHLRRAEGERLDERRQVVFVHRPGPVACPPAAGVAAAVVGDDVEGFGQRWRDKLPAAVIGPAAVDEHQRVAAPGYHAKQPAPVDSDLGVGERHRRLLAAAGSCVVGRVARRGVGDRRRGCARTGGCIHRDPTPPWIDASPSTPSTLRGRRLVRIGLHPPTPTGPAETARVRRARAAPRRPTDLHRLARSIVRRARGP